MSYILHLDTATDRGLYFIARDGDILLQKDSGDNRDHAATLSGIVADLLRETQLSFTHMDAFAVNGGPGSYTGLRISLAAAKGYCFALQKPLLLENRLLLLLYTLQAAMPDKNLLALLPARAGEYFAAAAGRNKEIILEPQHLFTEELSEIIAGLQPDLAAIGATADDLSGRTGTLLPPVYSPEVWAKIAFKAYKRKEFTDLAAAQPFYLKEAFTTQPRKTQS